MSSPTDTMKDVTESLGSGLVFAAVKAGVDSASGKKVTMYSAGKNVVIAAAADLVYDYGKRQKWWPWK